MSDSHGYHSIYNEFKGADLLIHCGDIGMRGSEAETNDFISWFNNVDIKHKIFIAGNHDFYLEKATNDFIRAKLNSNVHYLNDSGVTIEGIHIWGSPVQPWFHAWAFNRMRGEEIKKHWDLIPFTTDILITHGPPQGIMDLTANNDVVGCEDLLEAVILVKPRIHAFGHIHEGYGIRKFPATTFINASVLNERYMPVHEPIIVEY